MDCSNRELPLHHELRRRILIGIVRVQQACDFQKEIISVEWQNANAKYAKYAWPKICKICKICKIGTSAFFKKNAKI
jgi:hypothetical protein